MFLEVLMKIGPLNKVIRDTLHFQFYFCIKVNFRYYWPSDGASKFLTFWINRQPKFF
jgi:hypothetical protein